MISARPSDIAPSRPKQRSPIYPRFTRDASPRPNWPPALRRVAGSGAYAFRQLRRRSVRSRSRPSGCSRKVIFTASGNAAATPAAGCSMIGARTTVGGGAKWKSGGIAPSKSASRRGGVRLEAPRRRSPPLPHARRNARRLLAGLGAGPGAALPHGPAGARPARGADRHSDPSAGRGRARSERRLHRSAAGRRASNPSRRLPLSFARTPPRIPRSEVLDPRRPALVGNAALLSRSLLAGDAGGSRRRSRAARRPERPSRCAARGRLWIANGAGGAAAGVDLRAAGGGLLAGLCADRTHQFRLRRDRRRGRLRGGDRRARHARLAARPRADRSLPARGRGGGRLGVRLG